MSKDSINRMIGRRMRNRRRILELTQSEVGKACGVCFQQIQKYEAGAGAISAGMLWRLTQVLEVDMAYFFDGLSGPRALGQDTAGARSVA